MRYLVVSVLLMFLAACSAPVGPSKVEPTPKEEPPVQTPAVVKPVVLERIPVPGSSNIGLGMPIRVVFNTTMKAETLNAQTVVVKLGDNSVQSQIQLDSEGKTATISLLNLQEVGEEEARFSVELKEGITDGVGNPLTLPSTPWSWTMAKASSELGELNSRRQTMLPTRQGGFVLAYTTPNISGPRDGTPARLQYLNIRRFDGTQWHDLTDPALGVNIHPEAREIGFSMQLDRHDNPVVAWSEYAMFVPDPYTRQTQFISHKLHAKRWNGSSWEELEGLHDGVDAKTNIYQLQLVLDSQDNPLALWQEYTRMYPGPDQSVIRAKVWRGGRWQQILEQQNRAFGLTQDANQTPVLYWPKSPWEMEMRRWADGQWRNAQDEPEAIGDEPGNFNPGGPWELRFTVDNTPVALVNGAMSRWNVAGWEPMPTPKPVWAWQLDARNRPVVWLQNHPTLMRWGDGGWADWLEIPPDSYPSQFKLDPQGNPAAITSGIASEGRLRFMRWDGKQWVQVKEFLSSLGPMYAITRPTLIFDLNGRTYVRWSYTGAHWWYERSWFWSFTR